MIHISLNNEQKNIHKNTTLLTLIEENFDDLKNIAAAINHEFIPKSRYDKTVLDEGDIIDIVSPVGGG